MVFRYQAGGATTYDRGPTTAAEVLAQWPRQEHQESIPTSTDGDDCPFPPLTTMSQNDRDGALMDATLDIADARAELAEIATKRQRLATKVDDPALAHHPSRPGAVARLNDLRADEAYRTAKLLRMAYDADRVLWRGLDRDYKLFGPYLEVWDIDELDDLLYPMLFWAPLDGSRAMPDGWRLTDDFWETHDADWLAEMRRYLITW